MHYFCCQESNIFLQMPDEVFTEDKTSASQNVGTTFYVTVILFSGGEKECQHLTS